MNDKHDAFDASRATLVSFVSLVLALAPQAWGQSARFAARIGAAPSVSAGAPQNGGPLSFGLVSALTAGPRASAAAPDDAAAAAPATPVAADAPVFASEDSVRGKTVVMVGTKGSRPFIVQEAVRVARELGLNLVLVDDPANRENSRADVPDSHFIAAPINTRSQGEMDEISNAVAAHPIASGAHAVVGFMSLYANLTGRITDRLGVAGIPGAAVAAADDKPEARKLLNAVPELAVPFREIDKAGDARAAFREVSENGKYKVVIKTSRGENSRFLALNLDSEEAAEKAYIQMDADVKAFVERPEARGTTFNTHPGLMMERMLETLPGTEETSVEVVMQQGKLAFAIVSDNKGIGANQELSGGILVFPSQQSEVAQKAMIQASGRALKALGIENGNARLDVIMTKDGARIVEINPFMGSVAIWKAVHCLTGMSLVEQGLRSILNLRVDPGHAPDGVVHYIFLASGQSGTLESIEGLEDARRVPGVETARLFVSAGESIVAAGTATYEEFGEIIGKGKTWSAAIDAAREGARRIVLGIRTAAGALVKQAGDYLQPSAQDLKGPSMRRPNAALRALFRLELKPDGGAAGAEDAPK